MRCKTTSFNRAEHNSNYLSRIWWALGSCLVMVNLACNTQNGNYEPSYTRDSSGKQEILFGLPAPAYYDMTDEFVSYLNEKGRDGQVQAVAAPSFNSYLNKLKHHDYDISIINGVTAVESNQFGYSIAARIIDLQENMVAIIVNKDSSVKDFPDLSGKTIASAGGAASGCHMLQMLFLNKHGLNVNRDIRLHYFESFESVALNVYLGKCTAGFITLSNWRLFIKRRPEIVTKVAVKWQMPSVISNALLIRNDLDPVKAEKIKNQILTMHETERGRQALAKIGFLKFENADNNSFKPVQDLIDEFNNLTHQSPD